MGLLEPRGCSAGSQEWEPQPGPKRLTCICLRMLMCLGDVSGSWEGGSGGAVGLRGSRGCQAVEEDPFLDCRAGSRSGQGGGRHWRLPQPAWVDGRSTPGSRRPAPAAWICKPRCCPLAPMPATSPMARIISQWPVSRELESSLLRDGCGKWEGFTSRAKLLRKL